MTLATQTKSFNFVNSIAGGVMLASMDEVRAEVIRRNADRGVVLVSVALSTKRLCSLGLSAAKARTDAADDLLVALALPFTPEFCEVEFLSADGGEHVIQATSNWNHAVAADALAAAGL